MITLRFPTLSLAAASAAWIGLAACGGNVVVDSPGAPGGGGAGTTTTPGTTTTTNTLPPEQECNLLLMNLTAAIDTAQSCNPVINVVQCTGKVTVHDACGCEVVLNDLDPQAISNAQSDADAYAGQCAPIECTLCPPPPPTPWFCNPNTMKCVPAIKN